MNNYFKTLQSIANTDLREFKDIKELTIAVAESGNYRRETFTYKNGNTRVRTMYGIKKINSNNEECIVPTWDDALVAKWILYFKYPILKALFSRPELSELYYDIVQRIFSSYFNALQIDKLDTPASIVRNVNLTISARVKEAAYVYGSQFRKDCEDAAKAAKLALKQQLRLGYISIEKYELEIAKLKTDSNLARHSMMLHKNAINTQAYSLEALKELNNFQVSDNAQTTNSVQEEYEVIEFINSMKTEFKQLANPIVGEKLLKSLLNLSKKINVKRLNTIVDTTNFSKSDMKDLKNAWFIIKAFLKTRLESIGYNVDKFDWIADKKI